MESNKQKQSIFQRIEKDFKLQLLICTVLSAIVIIVFLIVNNIVDRKKFHSYNIVDDIKLINAVENITMEDNIIKVEGYAFMLERNSYDNLISVFLRNVVSKKEIWLDTQQVERSDVNSYFEDKFEYSKSGFIASTDSKALDASESYEIIINIDYNSNVRRTVSTNRYILNGELYSYNPNEFDKPDLDIETELLKDVFEGGQLCLYQREEGMYVYQYEEKLYWIVTENFNFVKNGPTYITYHLYTTQRDKLPEHRAQYSFDNLDFDFEDFEYVDDTTGPYRVAIRDIPDEYPIAYIRTGVYDSGIQKSHWLKYFQLGYNFNESN